MVEDVCHDPECSNKIDRGVAYACGGLEGVLGGGSGCGGYFCPEHLWFSDDESTYGEFCLDCVSQIDSGADE